MAVKAPGKMLECAAGVQGADGGLLPVRDGDAQRLRTAGSGLAAVSVIALVAVSDGAKNVAAGMARTGSRRRDALSGSVRCSEPSTSLALGLPPACLQSTAVAFSGRGRHRVLSPKACDSRGQH